MQVFHFGLCLLVEHRSSDTVALPVASASPDWRSPLQSQVKVWLKEVKMKLNKNKDETGVSL